MTATSFGIRKAIDALVRHDSLNFLLTNRIPRRWATSVVGRISKSETPWVRDAAIGLWRLFSDLDLGEAKTQEFKSLHDCFVRELRDGARPIDPDPDVITSPCDGIVVACGQIDGTQLLQVKGSTYALADITGGPEASDRYRNGLYVTLRLTSTMYHRFHAPYAGTVHHVRYIPGDVWNVNPAALARVPRLYCRNERAVIDMQLCNGRAIAMIPVAAILVAGIRLHALQFPRTATTAEYGCSASFEKGAEMGWFEHGSTIIVLAETGATLASGVVEGARMQMGRALLRMK
jgi:phosphatidylserine decarboxylase